MSMFGAEIALAAMVYVAVSRARIDDPPGEERQVVHLAPIDIEALRVPAWMSGGAGAASSIAVCTSSPPAEAPSPEGVGDLVQAGFAVSLLAEALQVTRPTIYAWVDGGVPTDDKYRRVNTISRVLSGVKAEQRRFLPRIWKRQFDGSVSLWSILTADEIDEPAARRMLEIYAPVLDRMSTRPLRKSVAELANRTPQDRAPGWDELESLPGERP